MAKIQHYSPNAGIGTIAKRDYARKVAANKANAVKAMHAMAGAPVRKADDD